MGFTTLRLLDCQNGEPLSAAEVHEEVQRARRLLMNRPERETSYLPESFGILAERGLDSTVLVVERHEYGQAKIIGCIAYWLAEFTCVDPVTGATAARRVNVLRLLCVDDVPDRKELAIRLLLEAMLRGTIRSYYDDEDRPPVRGTMAVVFECNQRALRWAAKLNAPLSLIAPTDARVDGDPVLREFRDFADAKHAALGFAEGYRFAIANRTLLAEAARRNLLGSQSLGRAAAEIPVHYDLSDPYRRQIETAVVNIVRGHPPTLERLALAGDPRATLWGPPEDARMRIPLVDGTSGSKDFSD